MTLSEEPHLLWKVSSVSTSGEEHKHLTALENLLANKTRILERIYFDQLQEYLIDLENYLDTTKGSTRNCRFRLQKIFDFLRPKAFFIESFKDKDEQRREVNRLFLGRESVLQLKNPFLCTFSKSQPNLMLADYTPRQKVNGADLCLDRMRPNVLPESLKVFGINDKMFLTLFIYEDKQTASISSMMTLWTEVFFRYNFKLVFIS
jgi:hypothetical protein